MIDYVILNNPDDRVIQKACKLLAQGELVCFPTDTNWIVVSDPFNKSAVEKLYVLKNEEKNKHFSLLCDSISMASDVAIITDSTFRLLKKVIPGHYTFIFRASLKIQKILKASKSDHEIGLRFVPNPLVNKIIHQYQKPLLSTNITHEMLEIALEDPVYSALIEESQLAHQLALIIDPDEINFVGKSTIISFINETPEIIREGAGALDLFI